MAEGAQKLADRLLVEIVARERQIVANGAKRHEIQTVQGGDGRRADPRIGASCPYPAAHRLMAARLVVCISVYGVGGHPGGAQEAVQQQPRPGWTRRLPGLGRLLP